MENYAGIMRKNVGILESAPRGERPAIIALRAHAFCACNYVVLHSHTLSAREREGVVTRDYGMTICPTSKRVSCSSVTP